MRILVICRSLGLGGTERTGQNFAVAYQRASHPTAVFAYVASGHRQQRLEAEGIPVFIGLSEESFAAIEAFDPDIIHIHRSGMANADETAILRRLRHGRRRVLETNVFARVDYSEAMEFIDIHFQLTSWCMWRWRAWLGARRHQHAAIVLPNAIDPNDIHPVSPQQIHDFRVQQRIPPEAYLCGRIAQPISGKWHPQNIFAFNFLAKQDPSAHLLLIGLPDSLKPTLDSLDPDVRGRIRLLPVTTSDEQLSLTYSSLDCFLHAAATGESFGLVLTEAMMCHCPVVTASRPHKDNSQVEVVGHRIGGLVAGSLQSLPQATLELRQDQALRQTMRASVRQRVLDLFASDHVAAKALRAASIALESPDRATLIQRLGQEPDFQTDVSNDQIEQLLTNTIGGPRLSDLVQKALFHQPSIQKLIRHINRIRLGS